MFLRSLKRRAWSFLSRKMNLDWKLRSGVSILIRNYAEWCTFNDIFTNDEYGLALTETLKDSGADLRVLDLGANVGFFTIRLVDLMLQEHSERRLSLTLIEGSADVCAELRRRVAIKDERIKIEVLNGLVGKRSGTAALNRSREDSSNFVSDSVNTGAWTRDRSPEVQQYVDVETMVGASEVIDLIKCDIEGSEFDFIQAYPGLLARTQRLVVEFHAAFGDVGRAADCLKAAGFDRRQDLRTSEENPVVYFGRTHPLKVLSFSSHKNE